MPRVPSVLIGVPCSDTGRYSDFAESLSNLRRPDSSVIRFAVGTWRHYARNHLAKMALTEGFDFLLMIDDDHVFGAGLLDDLLAHDVDIVGALCLQRAEPYSPFCFSHEHNGVYETLDLHKHEPVLTEVAAVGTGAMLIRRSVFEAMPEPWFTVTQDSGEDMLFCKAAREAGFKIHCDLGSPVGHMTTTAVLPVRPDKTWKVGMLVSGETRITRDLPPPPEMTA